MRAKRRLAYIGGKGFADNRQFLAYNLACQVDIRFPVELNLDPLINHQMNQLLTQLGFVVVSEESVPRQKNHKVNVLNQWTYHARLYQAAHYVVENKDMNLIQLVSFGCGIDAITSDEVRDILKDGNKFYTQIKIDEIDNLGAAKIRLRSLKEAIAQQKGA